MLSACIGIASILSTHNIHLHDEIREILWNVSKDFFFELSEGFVRDSQSESATVNEPSVFKSMKFYCKYQIRLTTICAICRYSPLYPRLCLVFSCALVNRDLRFQLTHSCRVNFSGLTLKTGLFPM